ENVKRGLRAKIERGWRPGLPPLGYRNDKESRLIVPDGVHFETMKRLFGLALSGGYTVRQMLRTVNEDWAYRTPETRRYKALRLVRAYGHRRAQSEPLRQPLYLLPLHEAQQRTSVLRAVSRRERS